jgi:hypothetical protein
VTDSVQWLPFYEDIDVELTVNEIVEWLKQKFTGWKQ